MKSYEVKLQHDDNLNYHKVDVPQVFGSLKIGETVQWTFNNYI